MIKIILFCMLRPIRYLHTTISRYIKISIPSAQLIKRLNIKIKNKIILLSSRTLIEEWLAECIKGHFQLRNQMKHKRDFLPDKICGPQGPQS